MKLIAAAFRVLLSSMLLPHAFVPIIGVTMIDDAMAEKPEAEVLKLSKEKFQMMRDSDTARLDEILAPDFTLTHLTGHVGSRQEWLGDLKSKQFVYHSIDQKDASVKVNGSSAVVISKSVFDATIYGSRGTYRLQLTEHYERKEKGWSLANMVAKLY